MLVSAKEMIQAAYAGHYAIGAFNTNNLEWTKAILQAAEEMRAPVIVQVSEGAGKYMAGFKNVADIVKNVMEFQKTSVPVALHLDHGTYAGCKACIEAGFSSIMFDGSAGDNRENIRLTREMVETHSFYSLLYHVGIVPFAADDSYEAVVLDQQQAKLLGVAEGSCAFFHQRRTKTEDGRIYEYTRSYIRGDRVRLDVHMQKSGMTFVRTID